MTIRETSPYLINDPNTLCVNELEQLFSGYNENDDYLYQHFLENDITYQTSPYFTLEGSDEEKEHSIGSPPISSAPINSLAIDFFSPIEIPKNPEIEESLRKVRELCAKRHDKDGCIVKQPLLTALEEIEKILNINPKNAEAHFLKGDANMFLGQYYCSERYKLISAHPQVVMNSKNELAISIPARLEELKVQQNMYFQIAIDNLAEAITLDILFKVEASRHIGHCYYLMEEYERAISVYNEIFPLAPNDNRLRFYRGKSYYKLKMYREASEDLEPVVVNTKSSKDSLLCLVKCYLKINDINNARKHLHVLTNHFWQAYRDKNTPEVVRIANLFKAWDIEAFFPLKYFVLGTAYKAIENLEKSTEQFNNFINWHISYPDSECRAEDEQINLLMQLYLENKFYQDHTAKQLDALRKQLQEMEKITTFHSRCVNFLMGEIHLKATEYLRAFEYFKKANELHKKLNKTPSQPVTSKLHQVACSHFNDIELLSNNEAIDLEKTDILLSKQVALHEGILPYHSEAPEPLTPKKKRPRTEEAPENDSNKRQKT